MGEYETKPTATYNKTNDGCQRHSWCVTRAVEQSHNSINTWQYLDGIGLSPKRLLRMPVFSVQALQQVGDLHVLGHRHDPPLVQRCHLVRRDFVVG